MHATAQVQDALERTRRGLARFGDQALPAGDRSSGAKGPWAAWFGHTMADDGMGSPTWPR